MPVFGDGDAQTRPYGIMPIHQIGMML